MLIKKYASIYILFIVLIASGLALINYFIDPYMLFQSEKVSGFNDKKPATATRSKLYKPYNVISTNPHTIIVGNSRPEMGIDPESICWPPTYAPVYSLTFPGLSPYAQVRAMFHAVSTGQVKNILLGVDFEDFLDKRNPLQKVLWPKHDSEFYNRLLVDEAFQTNEKYGLNKAKDFSKGLFSLDALNDSIYTLLSQSPNSINRTVLGFNTAKDYEEIIRYEGAWVLFEQKKKALEKRFFNPGLSIHNIDLWSLEFEAIKQAIKLAVDKNISLTVFINPYHYTYLEIIRKAGYWDEFELFKKSLRDTVKQYGKGKVTLWDFALYSNYTVTLEPKRKDDTQETHWFWEPSHYKAELGELMLSDIFGSRCVENKAEAVGTNLITTNIEDHLISQQKQRMILLQSLRSSPL
jgi:hypothetical protein